MINIYNNLFIKLKKNLDKNDAKDINKLESICLDYDKVNLKLEIDYKLNRDDKDSENLKHINEFMVDKKLRYVYEGNC